MCWILYVGILRHTVEAYYEAYWEANCVGMLFEGILKKTVFQQTSHKLCIGILRGIMCRHNVRHTVRHAV